MLGHMALVSEIAMVNSLIISGHNDLASLQKLIGILFGIIIIFYLLVNLNNIPN